MRIAIGIMLQVLAVAATTSTRAGESATCFNGGEAGSKIGVWDWEGQSDWQAARAVLAPVLVFSFLPGRDAYDRSDLQYCFLLPEVLKATVVQCNAGKLEVTAIEPGKFLEGKFSLVLANGERRTRQVKAEHCPPQHN